MAMEIDYIDVIACRLQQDVVMVSFIPMLPEDDQELGFYRKLDWRTHPSRNLVISWLEARSVPWKMCGWKESEGALLPYSGHIFVDIPYDPSSADYQELEGFLEDQAGNAIIPETQLCFLLLKDARINQAQIDPNWGDAL